MKIADEPIVRSDHHPNDDRPWGFVIIRVQPFGFEVRIERTRKELSGGLQSIRPASYLT
jgi:hypothetical protein